MSGGGGRGYFQEVEDLSGAEGGWWCAAMSEREVLDVSWGVPWSLWGGTEAGDAGGPLLVVEGSPS